MLQIPICPTGALTLRAGAAAAVEVDRNGVHLDAGHAHADLQQGANEDSASGPFARADIMWGRSRAGVFRWASMARWSGRTSGAGSALRSTPRTARSHGTWAGDCEVINRARRWRDVSEEPAWMTVPNRAAIPC